MIMCQFTSIPFKDKLVYVRYADHIFYNRASALPLQPQIREAVGWRVYECDKYLTICWDRDAGPPTLHGGDPKASGLVLLKSDILELTRLKDCIQPLKENSKWHLNLQKSNNKDEYALQPKEAKNSKKRKIP